MANHKLGKLPKKSDIRTLQFARYLKKLPVPPVSVDRASRLPLNVGMMGNDEYGSCTITAAGHQIQSWTLYAERGMLTIPTAEIIRSYLTISPDDTGAYMLDALNYWRTTGVGGDNVEAFIELGGGDLTQAKLAIHHFGGVYIGMALPSGDNTFGPWIDAAGEPNPYNGHAVNLVAYDDETEMFKAMTWGEVWDMSYAWYQRYSDEAYALLNDISLIKATGMTPSGFDWAQLEYDLDHIGDPVVLPDPPPPPPVPDSKGCLPGGAAAASLVAFLTR